MDIRLLKWRGSVGNEIAFETVIHDKEGGSAGHATDDGRREARIDRAEGSDGGMTRGNGCICDVGL